MSFHRSFRFEKIISRCKIFALVSGIIAFSSCSHFRTYITWKYRFSNQLEKSLTIVFTNPIAIDYKGDIKDDLGGGGDLYTQIHRYLGNKLRLDIRDSACFLAVRLDTLFDRGILHVKKPHFIPSSDNFTIQLPDTGVTVTFKQSVPDFVLFLEDFKVESYVSVQVIHMGVVPVAAIPYKPVVYTAKYAFWDNRQGKIVAYGRVKASEKQVGMGNRDTWDKTSGRFANQILDRTPFYHWNYH